MKPINGTNSSAAGGISRRGLLKTSAVEFQQDLTHFFVSR